MSVTTDFTRKMYIFQMIIYSTMSLLTSSNYQQSQMLFSGLSENHAK